MNTIKERSGLTKTNRVLFPQDERLHEKGIIYARWYGECMQRWLCLTDKSRNKRDRGSALTMMSSHASPQVVLRPPADIAPHQIYVFMDRQTPVSVVRVRVGYGTKSKTDRESMM